MMAHHTSFRFYRLTKATCLVALTLVALVTGAPVPHPATAAVTQPAAAPRNGDD